MYTSTKSATSASTYTAIRARDVTQRAAADLQDFVARGFLSRERLEAFVNDIRAMLAYEEIESFEYQVDKPDKTRCGLVYKVDDSGVDMPSDDNRGIDPWLLPDGCRGQFVIKSRAGSEDNAAFVALTQRLGWTSPAQLLEGATQSDRVYSKDGYGLRRSVVGSFT
jgi:hypothetical protein